MGNYGISPLLASVVICGNACACVDEIGQSRLIAPDLLRAVIVVESGGNPRAVNQNTGSALGTRDVGAMQINTTHLPALAKAGITEARLLDYCTNVGVGADILHGLLARHGVTWNAIGAYNASCSKLKGAACQQARSRYAWKVYRSSRHCAPARRPDRSPPRRFRCKPSLRSAPAWST